MLIFRCRVDSAPFLSRKYARIWIAMLVICFATMVIGCGGGGSDSQPAIAITATDAPLSVGNTSSFSATVQNFPGGEVSWSVLETSGGTITPQGVYTAPAKAGVYHVVASLVQDPTVHAAVAVTVESGSVSGSVTFPDTGDLPVTVK